jgi:hypothetical protein
MWCSHAKQVGITVRVIYLRQLETISLPALHLNCARYLLSKDWWPRILKPISKGRGDILIYKYWRLLCNYHSESLVGCLQVREGTS